MADFMTFIEQAAGTLGVSSDEAGTAASGVLDLIKDKADPSDVTALISALPGAETFLGGSSKSGGLAGGLLGAASGLLGGKAGTALTVMSIFQKAGMDSNQAGSFLGMFMDFITKNAGGDLVGRILEQVPDLKKVVGT